MFDCGGGGSNHKKRKKLQTIEIKIKIDCEGCESKVRRSVEGMKRVTSVEVFPKQKKLTVMGYMEPHKLVARVAHRMGKKAKLWPYDVVVHIYLFIAERRLT